MLTDSMVFFFDPFPNKGVCRKAQDTSGLFIKSTFLKALPIQKKVADLIKYWSKK